MGSIEGPVYGIFQYGYPMPQSAWERPIFTFPDLQDVREEKQVLHNFRESNAVTKGPEGLDVQGFTFVEHESALSGEDWFDQDKLEKVYVPEMIELMKKTTGATKVAIHGFTLRKTVAKEHDENVTSVMKKKDDAQEKRMKQAPNLDKMRFPTRESAAAMEPARILHVDYNVNGLRTTARYSRTDIAAMAKPTIEAEDAGKKPRYAAYGTWRPLDTVKRDPLALLDSRSIPSSDILPVETRMLSGVLEAGDVVREGSVAAPPKDAASHRWYWVPEQKPNEVAVIKFADTGATEENGRATTCVHGSPKLPGTEEEAVRSSINCRILCFWE